MCKHKIGIWLGVSEEGDQFYKLYCAACGQYLGAESYIPFEPCKPFIIGGTYGGTILQRTKEKRED